MSPTHHSPQWSECAYTPSTAESTCRFFFTQQTQRRGKQKGSLLFLSLSSLVFFSSLSLSLACLGAAAVVASKKANLCVLLPPPPPLLRKSWWWNVEESSWIYLYIFVIDSIFISIYLSEGNLSSVRSRYYLSMPLFVVPLCSLTA